MLIPIAILLSVDATCAGLSYGIKKIKIPFLSKLIIGICTMLGGLLSVTLGNTVTQFLSPYAAKVSGGFIFLAIGTWFLLQTLIQETAFDNNEILSRPIHSLGITVTIMKNPEITDVNNSGRLDSNEAVVAGIALAADVLASGIAFGISGASPILLPLFTAVFQVIFLSLGCYIGEKFRGLYGKYTKICVMLPGIIMILLGICKLT